MKKKESKSFDKILKENLAALFLPLSEKWLGFKIVRSRDLPEKIQTTLEREPDFIKIVETESEEKFILHLEFQTTNDSEMAHRQAEYKAILQRKYKIPVRQYVMYLGSQPMTMQNTLPEAQRISGFELWNIQDYDYENLLLSDVPQEIVLAILGDFHGESSEKIIRLTLNRLQEVVEGKRELQKFVKQLTVLAGLRKLQSETTKILETMLVEFDFDIEADVFYQLGVEETTKNAVIEMLKDGVLTIEQIAKYQRISIDEVLEIKEEWEGEQIDLP